MTISEIKKNYPKNAAAIINAVRAAVAEYSTTWSACRIVSSEEEAGYTSYGYRKCTTGEYVPYTYRVNFGWKNTYYQAAEMRVYIPAEMQC